MMSDKRADPFADDLDLSDFAPKPAQKPPAPREAIRAVSEANNFPSRAPSKKGTATEPAPVLPQRRRRTGRNVQLNIKVSQATLERFTALSDARGWVFGETLEHALDALENQSTP